MAKKPFKIEEIGNTYVGAHDRFVVSLVVGYNPQEDHVYTPEQALAAALALTKDCDSGQTNWYVHDRKTRITHLIEQEDAGADVTCSNCEKPLTPSPSDDYYATPCGSFCEEHMTEHVKGCEICADEFPEAVEEASDEE